jgi:hypothetical protein
VKVPGSVALTACAERAVLTNRGPPATTTS